MIYINQDGQTELGRGTTISEAFENARTTFPELTMDEIKRAGESRNDGDVYWTDEPVDGYNGEFSPTAQAYPTNRVIPGACSAMDPQEWAEPGEIDGVPATRYYMFSEEEASSEDASDYPWDDAHVDRIEINA